MPRTPERSRAPIDGEELRLAANVATPVVGGAVYDGAAFVMRDALGTFNPRTGGTGGNAAIVYYDEAEAEFATTSGSFVDAATFSLAAPDGDYLLAVSAEMRATSVQSRAAIQVEAEGSIVSETVSGVGIPDTGDVLWYAYAAIDRVAVVGGASVVFRVRKLGQPGSAGLRRMRVALLPGAFL